MQPPPASEDRWCALSADPLPLATAYEWVLAPDCGAVVVFSGTARDHSDGRRGVTLLEYEAYESQAVPAFDRVVSQARTRWPSIGRVAVLHRVGPLSLTETAVIVAVAAPHRSEAFEAARFCIEALKADAPIWKREHHDGGVDWAHPAGVEGSA